MVKMTFAEYLKYIQISNKKHLIVEGKSDKDFIDSYFDKFLADDWDSKYDVDTAEYFLAPNIAANDQKVKTVCNLAANSNIPNLFGFVDRMDFEFSTEGTILDRIRTHYQDRNLIYSRGHSIENYFFNETIICAMILELNSNNNRRVSRSFRNLLQSIINIACAISLVCSDYRNLESKRIYTCIDWNILSIDQDGFYLICNDWKNKLIARGLGEDISSSIISSFQRYLVIIQNSDIYDIRWFTHGHIGVFLLRRAIARCFYDSCQNEERQAQIAQVMVLDDNNFFHVLVRRWVDNVELTEHPVQILNLLTAE